MVAQAIVCLSVHLTLPQLVGYADYSFTPELNLDTSMLHAHLVRQGLKIVMNLNVFIPGNRTRDSAVEIWLFNHSATDALYKEIDSGGLVVTYRSVQRNPGFASRI